MHHAMLFQVMGLLGLRIRYWVIIIVVILVLLALAYTVQGRRRTF